MVRVFEAMGGQGGSFEQVVFCHDRPSGLRAVVAIHSTLLGPALGGTRFHPYEDEDEAVADVLRLARGMTYKSAAAGLDLGGGKAVIIGDPATDRSEALLRTYARFVDSLGGRYVTAEDVGTTQADMDLIRRDTVHVTGTSRSLGGSGDPSAATAYGVLQAMRAVAGHLWGETSLTGRHVVVSGVGKVGYSLAGHLVEERARLTLSDVRTEEVEVAAAEFGADIAAVEKAHAVDCDVFSPCAMGGALDPSTIAELRCSAVVGSANNQLADDSCVRLLDDAGILYAPDYIVNAGGVINIAEELRGYDQDRAYANVARIFATTASVLDSAAELGISTVAAADALVERRMAAMSDVGRIRRYPERR